MNARRCLWQTSAVLVAISLAREFGLAGPTAVWVTVVLAVVLVIARRAGAGLDDLGLRWADAGAGLRYGAAAFALVLLVLTFAAVLPGTHGFLHDSRGAISGGRLVFEVGVSIVLLTAIPEEIAFRGILLGSAVREWGTWRGTLVTSALFGLWHIEPTLHTMSGNSAVEGASKTVLGQVSLVLGAVAVTFVAGLVFAWLRLRSRSLVAPIIAHVATNGLALVFAWFAVH